MRRFLTLTLAALMLLLSGCARLFEKEYVSEKEYEDPEISSDSETQEIHDYAGLLRLMNAMVANFETQQSLIFTNYDGIIADDLSKACWELRSNTALGSYCVQDIEYTTEQVVAYCEADITVSYKRSEAEVKGLTSVQTRSGIAQCAADALEDQKSKFAVLMNTNALTENDVKELVLQTCLDHPALAVEIPTVDVTMFSGETSQRIFEITMHCTLSAEETAQRREAVLKATNELVSAIEPDAANRALEAAVLTAEQCCRNGESGSTAYDALVLGNADSQGLAMAYRAVCDALDVDCLVINGQFDGGVHVWNIVSLEKQRYHLDLVGYSGTLWLQPDRDIWGRYWWNVDRYPACDAQGFSWHPGESFSIAN